MDILGSKLLNTAVSLVSFINVTFHNNCLVVKENNELVYVINMNNVLFEEPDLSYKIKFVDYIHMYQITYIRSIINVRKIIFIYKVLIIYFSERYCNYLSN